MKAIAWDDSLSVGVQEIDSQHQQLIDIINDLDATMAGEDETLMRTVIERLKDYAIVHFDTEEGLLEAKDYPDLKNHQLEHWEFIKKVKKFDQGHQLGLKTLREELVRFLTQWLIRHIKGTDSKYAPFLAGKGLR